MRTLSFFSLVAIVGDIQISLEKIGDCDTTLAEFGRVIVFLLNGKVGMRMSVLPVYEKS